MTFESTERLMAFPADKDFANVPFAFWDDTDHTVKRTAIFGEDIKPIPLSDGRIAFKVLWEESNDRSDGEELTMEQYLSLLPTEGEL